MHSFQDLCAATLKEATRATGEEAYESGILVSRDARRADGSRTLNASSGSGSPVRKRSNSKPSAIGPHPQLSGDAEPDGTHLLAHEPAGLFASGIRKKRNTQAPIPKCDCNDEKAGKTSSVVCSVLKLRCVRERRYAEGPVNTSCLGLCVYSKFCKLFHILFS